MNDLFATTSDPQAWEFRHPLFRRGEPHLLASIKRKSARPAHAEAGSATSPTDDPGERIAGWMRPDRPYATAASPPRDSQGARVFGYNLQTGETVLPRNPIDSQHRPTSRGRWDLAGHQPSASVSSRSTDTPLTRYHPDPSRPILGTQRYGAHSDPSFFPATERSAADPTRQLAALEDQVRKLTAVLNGERVDNARSHLNATSYMLQMLDWIGGQAGEWTCRTEFPETHKRAAPGPSEVRAMRDSLQRQSMDQRQHYEALMASDALASLAGSGMTLRDDQSRQGRLRHG